MVLNFGGLFGKGIFESSPEDDEYYHQEGERQIAGKSAEITTNTVPINNNIDVDPARTLLSTITLNNLKPTDTVLFIYTTKVIFSNAGDMMYASIFVDEVYQSVNAIASSQETGTWHALAHSWSTIPTAATHVFKLYAWSTGSGNSDIKSGQFSAILFHGSG